MKLLVILYSLSVCLEPLLFFVLASRNVTGVGGNISRLLQFLTLSLFSILLIAGGAKIKFPKKYLNPFLPEYRFYTIFFLIACVSGLIGFANGKYDLPFSYGVGERTGLAATLNSRTIRPLFEYFITIYYFFYFVVLPFLILKKKSDIHFFIKALIFSFLASFIIGWINVIPSFTGIYLLPRHLDEWMAGEPRFVPYRYHGLAGEPRDAFVYLVFGGLVYYIINLLKFRKMSKIFVIALIGGLGLTKSGSGMLGVLIFLGLLPAFINSKQSVKNWFLIIFIYIFGFLGVSFSILFIPRLNDYYHLAMNVFSLIETKQELPYNIMVQANNIYPIYSLFQDFENGNLYSVLLGNGFGSASIVNNIFSGSTQMDNPHSMLIRIVYETGILGLLCFILAFWIPIKKEINYFSKKQQRIIYISILLLISVNLAHRSSTIYIFLGLIFSIKRFLLYFQESKNGELLLKESEV